MDIIPDLFVGFPCEETWLPLGTKLAGMFKTIARITNSVGDMASQTAGLDLTQAGWARRLEEWVHQVEVLDIEIQQIERQILAAERRQDGALRELNNHQRQIENSKEVQDFLRDKFTNHELYLYLQKETAALHAKCLGTGIARGRAGRARLQLRARRHRPPLSAQQCVGHPARRAHGRRAATACPSDDGEGIPGPERPGVRAHQALFACGCISRSSSCS